MSEAVVDDIVAVLPPLLQSLEALGFVARHLNPPDFGRVMEAAGKPDEALRAVRQRLAAWPADFSEIRAALEAASDAALAAFDGLREVQNGNGDLVSVFRALRYAPRAQEALYPLVAKLPPVSQFFVEPTLREDADLLARLAQPANDNTGIFHDDNEPGSRGGFSLYVPEYYTPDRTLAIGDGAAWRQRQRPRFPVELAARRTQPRRHLGRAHRYWQHLGADGRRRRHAEPDADSGTGALALEYRRHRMLLTGMSDGGTFSYVSGLESASPFTHLAPVSATFHPLMAEMADAYRLRGLPIHSCTASSTGCFRCRWRGNAAIAVRRRRQRHLSRTRRSQPLLSARDERACPGMAERTLARSRCSSDELLFREPSPPHHVVGDHWRMPCERF